MSNSPNPAPAGPVDTSPNDLHAIANTLPDNAFDFDDEDNGDDGPAESDGRQTPEPRRSARREPEPTQEPEDGNEGEEGDADQPDDGSDADGAVDEAEGQEGDEEGEPEKAAAPEKPETKADFVEIDGHKVPLDEVRRGFLRQADYTRKTQEVAQASREIQSTRQQLETERTELNSILDIATQLISSRMPQAPDKSMIRDDPMGYLERQQEYQDAVAEVEKLLGARQQVTQRTTAEQRKAQADQEAEMAARESEFLRAEQAEMVKVLPVLATDEGKQAFFKRAIDLGSKHYKLTDADVLSIKDHRLLPILDDALKYREMRDKAPAVLERVKSAPPIRPAVRQGPGTRTGDNQRRAMDRLRREGTIEAAAATLDDSLFD